MDEFFANLFKKVDFVVCFRTFAKKNLVKFN